MELILPPESWVTCNWIQSVITAQRTEFIICSLILNYFCLLLFISFLHHSLLLSFILLLFPLFTCSNCLVQLSPIGPPFLLPHNRTTVLQTPDNDFPDYMGSYHIISYHIISYHIISSSSSLPSETLIQLAASPCALTFWTLPIYHMCRLLIQWVPAYTDHDALQPQNIFI
jgi:hypothetical protein